MVARETKILGWRFGYFYICIENVKIKPVIEEWSRRNDEACLYNKDLLLIKRGVKCHSYIELYDGMFSSTSRMSK
jgi:hypothetical protein